MIARETKNIDEIKSILFDDEIWNRVKADNCNSEFIEDCKYIGCYLDGKIVGVGMYHQVEDFTMCHMNILKEHRKTIGLEFGKEALKHSPSDTLYTNIPEIFPGIMRYVEALGFKLVSVVKDAIKKDGKNLSVSIYKLSGV